MVDVIIFYAREDQEFVRKLHRMLEKRHRNDARLHNRLTSLR